MKKGQLLLLLMLFMGIFLTACGKEDLGDTYVEGMDYQYMLDRAGYYEQKQARGENGMFFLQGHYIYYLDDATRTLTAMCSKANCLHNEETDETKYAECDAYLEKKTAASSVAISYHDGYLYCLDTKRDEAGWYNILYRMKEDGTEKEIYYQWDDDFISHWCIHRGALYYIERVFIKEVNEETGEVESVERYSVKTLGLSGFGKEIKTIYEPPENEYTIMLEGICAYGNYVYFENLAFTVSDLDGITAENELDYLHNRQVTYHIRTGEIGEIKLENGSKYQEVQRLVFWKDKLVLAPFDFGAENAETATVDVYIADLDGSNQQVLFDDVPHYYTYLSDGNYLYVSNLFLVSHGTEETEYYKVYDQDLELVDTLGMPFKGAGDLEIGTAEGLYFFTRDTEDKTRGILWYFDKSTIGNYNGEPYECTHIADFVIPKADKA